MRHATMTALALLGAFSWGPSPSYAARSDSDAMSRQRCEDAVIPKLNEAPGVRDAQLSPQAPEISHPNDGEIRVLGDGDYRTESPRHFAYSCTDNLDATF